MTQLKLIAITVIAVFLLFLSKQFGFLVDVTVFSLAFIFTVKFREQIADTISRKSDLKYRTVLLSALPFILFEELVNAPLEILIITIPALSLSIFLLVFLAKKLHVRKMLPTLLTYCIIGILFEVNIGGASAQFATLPPATYAFMIFWVGLSYAFLAIVPLTIYLNKIRLK